MKKILIFALFLGILFVCYWGYVEYKNKKYVDAALSYKESLYVATKICITIADNLKERYDKEGIDLRMNGYTNEENIELYQTLAFGDLKYCVLERSSSLLDSLLKSAYSNLIVMRKYMGNHEYEQKSFEDALEKAKLIINKSKRGEYPIIYYNRMKIKCDYVFDKLEESDISIGPITEETETAFEKKIKYIFSDCK